MSDRTVDERGRNDATVDERGGRGDVTVDERRRGDTTVDERSSALARTGRLRTILPDELLMRYEPIQNLKVSAGQADLVLAKNRATNEEVVVKLYRSAGQLDREVLTKLYQAEDAHVVRLLKHGETEGEPWEVQEFCALGTLHDYRLDKSGKLSEATTKTVVHELAAAVKHVHDLGITHRDLKPENVLVRDAEPLNLVLTDFGVAAEQIVTVQLQTVAASWAWAAPEVHTKGTVASSIDWWALGAIIFQMLTGRHLVANAEGRLPEEKQIRAIIVDGLYTTEAITSVRWRDLVDGLLSYHPTDRWGYAEVNKWLAGGNSPVVRTTPVGGRGRAQESREIRYVFNGVPVRTGVELVQAMRRDWQVAGELLAGRIDPGLETWLKTRPSGDSVVAAVQVEKTGGARLVRLQHELDPDGQLEFQGRQLTDAEFDKAIRSAGQWKPGASGEIERAHKWLQAVRRERVLGAMASVLDGSVAERVGRADVQLDKWSKQTSEVLELVKDQQLKDFAEGRVQTMTGFMYSVALGGASTTEFNRQVAQTIKNRDDQGYWWMNDLVKRAEGAAPADLGVLIPAEGVISQATQQHVAARRLAEETQRATERRQAAERRRARLRYLVPRYLIASAVYAAVAATIRFAQVQQTDRILEYFWPVLVGCLLLATFAAGVDAAFDNPSGELRGVGLAAGIGLALGSWHEILWLLEISTATTPVLLEAPVAVVVGWVVGTVAIFVWNRFTNSWSGRPWRTTDEKLANFSNLPTLLGATAALSAVFSANCYVACQAWEAELAALAGYVPWPYFDPLGLQWRNPLVAYWLTIFAMSLLAIGSRVFTKSRLGGRSLIVLSMIINVLVFLGRPTNPLTATIAAAVREFG